jgi:hypothetical protein
MEGLRRVVVFITFVSLAGGVWARYLYASSDLAESAVGVRQPPESSAIQVTGTFEEPLAGSIGFEVLSPSCPHPLAVLPVSMKRSAIIPTEYRYHQGDFDVSYVYNGAVYPEANVSYRLSFLHVLYRFESMFGLIEGRRFAFYLKIWTPSGCPAISSADASALEQGLIARIEAKDA